MFTFSFSTAFAATQEEFADTYSATIGDQYFELVWADVVDTTDGTTLTMKAAGVDYTVDKSVVAGFKADAKAIYDYYMLNTATAYVTTEAELLAAVLNFGEGATDTTAQAALKLAIAEAQFVAAKDKALAVYTTIPTYNYATAEVSNAVEAAVEAILTTVDVDGKTYQEVAALLVEHYVAAIEKCDDTFDADVKVSDYFGAIVAVKALYDNEVYPMAYATYTGATVDALAYTGSYDLAIAYGTLPTYTANGTTVTFIDVMNSTNLWSTAVVEAQAQVDAAKVASVKAELAAQYADFLSKNTSATAKTYADKWLKVANILAEAEYTAAQIADPNGSALLTQATAIAKLEAFAARYGAELNADGEFVRDAAVVQKYLEAGIVAIAKATDADVETAYTEYEGKIYGAQSEALAARLQYVKDSANKAVELKLAAIADNYYAAEYAKVEAAAAKCTTAIAAATTEAKVKTAYGDFLTAIGADKITTAAALDAQNTAAEQTIFAAAEAYVAYYNTPGVAGTETKYLDKTTLADRINTLIGESGYRTQAEIKTLKNQAVAIAQALPTNADVAAAKKAIKTAVAAIPAKATIADLATLQAVEAAVEAYDELTTVAHGVSLNAYTTALGQIEAAYNTQFAQSYATVDKKDAAAVAALIAELDAAADTIEDLEELTVVTPEASYIRNLETLLENALVTIKTNEKAAVVKLIEALPINITEADKAAVEAARDAYDAYVAKYTDITTYYAGDLEKGYAADDIDAAALAVLTSAETVLGLNDKSEEIAKMEAIADIEGLKIKANSSAKKGSITVKWTVSEEVEGVKYQVYKSTKAQKGYKKSITTSKTSFKNTKNIKKGTRYYYKVRAIGVVDGVTYYSDWSNKANRIAK